MEIKSIEQSLELQIPLYTVFVDFQSRHLEYHYGFPPKFVTIILQLYENATCQLSMMGSWRNPSMWSLTLSTKTDLAMECWGGGPGRQNDVYRTKEDIAEPCPWEECCCGHIFHEESRVWSQVSHWLPGTGYSIL